MRQLYEQAWEKLRELRSTSNYIEEECTPILVFGSWRTARVATAGLNPSTYEFRDPERSIAGEKAPLAGDRQRFVHWGDGHLTRARLDEAFRRSEGYFKLGNHYAKWFDKYAEFLDALNAPFADGRACHTDYVSPFATRVGISRCKPAAAVLEDDGLQCWLDAIELCPRIELIFGHGRGWRRVEERLGITLEDKQTPFEHKGKQGRHLSCAEVTLPKSRRSVLIYWWHQNFSGMPLCSLKPEERRQLGTIIGAEVKKRAPRSDVARWATLVRD